MDRATGGFSDNSVGENQYFASEFHELSHEFRNPLNSISGFAELLLMDEGLSPASADYARAILSGSKALTDAVVSYLDRVEERGAGASESKPVPEAVQAAPQRSSFKRARSFSR